MRTKSIILAAALCVAGITTSIAQTVYSVNAVGYVNVTVTNGQFALLTNPLNQPTNDIPTLLPDVPANTVIYAWNGTGFDSATKRTSGSWTGPGATAKLNPGQGFFIKNAAATNITITFVGEVMQGTNTVTFKKGFSLIGSIVPQAGKVQTDLGLPAQPNDVVYVFRNGAYANATKRASGSWTGPLGGEPDLGVAEGFFYNATADGNWTRAFSVNQ